MRYSLARAETIRKDLELTPEQFSIRIGYSSPAYRLAMNRGWLTKHMAAEIGRRWKIPLSLFKENNDGLPLDGKK